MLTAHKEPKEESSYNDTIVAPKGETIFLNQTHKAFDSDDRYHIGYEIANEEHREFVGVAC